MNLCITTVKNTHLLYRMFVETPKSPPRAQLFRSHSRVSTETYFDLALAPPPTRPLPSPSSSLPSPSPSSSPNPNFAMDFFKSVFSADPEVPDPSTESQLPSKSPRDGDDEQQQEEGSPKNPSSKPISPSFGLGIGGGGAWDFGSLVKTITSRSESVIQTYRRDLEEFSAGLKNETSVFKEVAARAVLDLPGSLEVGASVATESLETVGQAIDEFGGSVWRGTAEIISHGKEALLSMDSESNSPQRFSTEASSHSCNNNPNIYSRYEIQVHAFQNDANTFVEEPEDSEDFEKWRSGFKLEDEEGEIEGLLYDNETVEGFFEKFVPDVVDREMFWSRYFYRVYRLKQAEDARAKLVKRVIEAEEEEELSWDVDDDDDEEEIEVKDFKEKTKEGENVTKREKTIEEAVKEAGVETSQKSITKAKDEIVESPQKAEELTKKDVVETLESVEEKPVHASKIENVEEAEEVKLCNDASPFKADDKVSLEIKYEHRESGKDSDFSVILSQPSMQEEEDLGWDEIADIGEHEDKNAAGSGGSPKKLDFKRLSTAEEDEDLSWDIEVDDDETAKT